MSKGPDLIVLGRREVEQYQPPPGYHSVCISITDPRTQPAKLSPDFRAVLRLVFHDITKDDLRGLAPQDVKVDDGRQHAVLMTEQHARAIVEFAAHHATVDYLVIHCEMGVSRSRSVAEALFDAFGRRAPNQYVYRMVHEAFRAHYNDLPTHWVDFRWAPERRGPRS